MTERGDPRVEVTEAVADSSVPREEPAPDAPRASRSEAQARPGAEAEVQKAEAAVEHDSVIQTDLARIASERDDYLEALKRLQADFENYKKRIIKQQTEHLERAAEALVEKLLPALDTFDLALAHGEGFDQVHSTLMTSLEKEGLERIDPLGKPFDPNEHDAVAHEEADAGAGAPVVSDVMRTGYRFKGKLLRPAMVKVKG